MSYAIKNKSSAAQQDLKELFLAKIRAIISGDFDAFRKISNEIFYAQLDSDDPKYKEKLANHRRFEREHNAVQRAQQVIDKSGQPMEFRDSLAAVNGAIEYAVEIFERYPCPLHAADLLGLIECRGLLFDANLEMVSTAGEDETE